MTLRTPLTEVGWFDSPSQVKPAHDPGLATTCPVCSAPLSLPVVTTSLMGLGGDKSYFFRAHKKCWDTATESRKAAIEGDIIDTYSVRLN